MEKNDNENVNSTFFFKKLFFVSEKQVIHFAIVLPRCFPISLSFSLQLRLFMFLKTLNKHLNLKKIHFFVVIRRTPFVGHCSFLINQKFVFHHMKIFISNCTNYKNVSLHENGLKIQQTLHYLTKLN
jgi:hypothetical protein